MHLIEVFLVVVAGSYLFLLTLIAFIASVHGLTAFESSSGERGRAFIILGFIFAVWIFTGINLAGILK